jgi:GNAT superfamily N-acetyltransferase
MYECDVWIRRDGGIAVTVSIIAVTMANLEMVLPLIADYQTFYHATPDTERNRAHFGALVTTPAIGAQWMATNHTGNAIGFVTAYRAMSSVSAAKRCLLNDLYVAPDQRGAGVGRQLILHCTNWALSEGYPGVYWQTDHDNYTAQKLYDSLPTSREAVYIYTLQGSDLTKQG